MIILNHEMDDDQWSALVKELQRADVRLETAARELRGGLEVLRGRDLDLARGLIGLLEIPLLAIGG